MTTWVQLLTFHAGNGAVLLAEHFDVVTTTTWSRTVELLDAAVLIGYIDSLREPIELALDQALPWTDVLRCAANRTSRHIARDGSLRFDRRGSIHLAR